MCCVMGYAGHDLSKDEFTQYLLRTASRGPDDHRVAETEFGLIGFGRLAIMGLTPEGMQPFFRGSDCVVCNGELYGFRPVKEELEKEGFAKESIDKYLELFEKTSRDAAGVRWLKEALDGYLDPAYADGLELIMDSVDAVKTADFRVAFDPTLVRGMSYYTGPIFEISMDEYGGSVGGGGRYDEMIGKFTGNNVCACGFSIGFERIIMLLMERGFKVPGAEQKKALLIEKNMPADGMKKVLAIAREERAKGVQVTIAVMKKNKKFQKDQLKAEGYEEIQEFFADRM